MQVEKIDSDPERFVLLGMVLSTPVLAQIDQRYNEGLFENQWASIIATWCIRHYRTYREAPGNVHIVQLFESWAGIETRDRDLVRSINRVLQSLSDFHDGTEINVQFTIDQASLLFNRKRLFELQGNLLGALQEGRITDAEQALRNWEKVELGTKDGVDLFNASEEFRQAAASKNASKSLITYEGAMQEFIGDAFDRGNFVAFLGKDKSGKSMFLLDAAWRAILQRRRVAYFEAGDMSQNDVMRRILCRVGKRPWLAGEHRTPARITRDISDDVAHVTYSIRQLEKGLDVDAVLQQMQKYYAQLQSDSPWRLSCYPSGSLSVADIQLTLEDWYRTLQWTPDVVVVDYVDILRPISPKLDERGRINETWTMLRGLAQEWNCLVLTATQADADSYEAHTLRRSNFSGDKRKNSHATGIIGINATDFEIQMGIRRLNWIVLRDRAYDENKCVHLGTDLAAASPAVVSCW